MGTGGPQLRAPDVSGHCRASTVSSRSQWALPDLNCELQIAVGTAGPQPRAPDVRALPDLNCELQISMGTAGPQPRAPVGAATFRSHQTLPGLNRDLSGHCWTSTTSARCQGALPGFNREFQITSTVSSRLPCEVSNLNSDRSAVGNAGLQLRAPGPAVPMPERMPHRMPERMPE